MRKMWTKLFTTAALTFMLCMTGLVMSGEAHAQRLVDNGNGTVTDTQTGLMWTKDALPVGRGNWYQAQEKCASYSIGDIGGWRLPSKEELVQLYHAKKGGHPFTGIQTGNYWSSEPYLDWDSAWAVMMYIAGDITVIRKTYGNSVWCVRAK